jgi:hypothetical protein
MTSTLRGVEIDVHYRMPCSECPDDHQVARSAKCARPPVLACGVANFSGVPCEDWAGGAGLVRVTPVTDGAACHRQFRLPLRHAPPEKRRISAAPSPADIRR